MSIYDNVKHQLENEWNFWLYTNRHKDWNKNLQMLTSFNTVEDYWCLYHHMKLPSELEMGLDYAVFKKGIVPKWEHEANEKGGRWQIIFDELTHTVLDSVWSDLVLLMIGESFKNMDIICGVVVNVRIKNKISLWTSNIKNSAALLEIGRKIKQSIPIPNRIQYYQHLKTKCLHTV